MTPESPTHTPPTEETLTAVVDTVAESASRKAHTASEFQREFGEQIRAVIGNDGAATDSVLARAFEDRRRLIKKAMQGATSASLENHEDGVEGTNVIGGGDASMTLNRNTVAAVRDEEDARNVQRVVAHEKAHGEAVPLHGALALPGVAERRKNLHLLLQEGWAEVEANEAIGESPDDHRAGQPKEVYGEGQDLVLDLIARTSRKDVEALMTEHGDLDRFRKEAALVNAA